MPSSSSVPFVFPIFCGSISGQFHLEKFTQGGRSKCIQVPKSKEYLTPVEFEHSAGRGASHNWKRTIKYKSKSLGHWMEEGHIKVPSPNRPQISSVPLMPTTAPAATAIMPPKPVLPAINGLKAPTATTTTGGLDTTDSDSGISVASFTKALKIDVGNGNGTITPPSSSQGKVEKSQEVADEVLMEQDEEVEIDYLKLIQEALLSLSESTTSSGGCSQLNVLLYILNKFGPSLTEDVSRVNEKVKNGLSFLSRMGVVRRESNNENEEEDEEDKEVSFNEGKETKDTKSGKCVSDSKASSKPTTVTSTSATAPSLPKSEATTTTNTAKSKTAKASPKPKTGKEDKENKKTSLNKVKKKEPLKSRPKRLSPALASICGATIMSRHEVVRQLWKYVKKNNLQDPKQRTVLLCDEKLRAVTGKKRLPQTEMLGCLQKHLKDTAGEVKVVTVSAKGGSASSTPNNQVKKK